MSFFIGIISHCHCHNHCHSHCYSYYHSEFHSNCNDQSLSLFAIVIIKPSIKFQRQSSALATLLSFSAKLSDMQRLINSHERRIDRQRAVIDQLSATIDSKADRSQFQALEFLLNSKMSTLKNDITTKELVIERYRNKLRQLEAEITVSKTWGRIYEAFLTFNPGKKKVLSLIARSASTAFVKYSRFSMKLNHAIGASFFLFL